jgi:chondroitin 4-sulfotransferase 11
MLISHKHKFIFLSTGKTGTTSIGSLLEKFRDHKVNFYKHCRLTEPSSLIDPRDGAEKELNFNSADYFTFCFVRNPWDRMLSLYNQLRKPIRPDTWESRKTAHDLSNRYSFTDFLKKLDHKDFDGYAQSNFYLIGGNGNLLDFIGRFENLQEDFDIICDKIGIPRQELPHKNKSKHKHYTEYYDDETKQIVAEKYAKDIEYFGYKFGE